MSDPIANSRSRIVRSGLVARRTSRATLRAMSLAQQAGGGAHRGAAALDHSGDVALLRRAGTGEPAARDCLARRLACIGRFVAALNNRHRHGLDPDEQADVVQEVAANVWAHREQYCGKAPLEAWVFAFCDHELRNAARRKRRNHASTTSLVVEPPARPPLDPTFGDELKDCLQRLAAWDQQAIHARFFEGLEFGELAARFACKINTIKSRFYRSIGQLHQCLTDKGIA